MSDELNACSFCGQGAPYRCCMIQGPNIRICCSCVGLAAQIIAEEMPAHNQTRAFAAVDMKSCCAMCGRGKS